MIFQDYKLLPRRTYENAFALHVMHAPKIKQQVNYIDLVGLTAKSHHYP